MRIFNEEMIPHHPLSPHLIAALNDSALDLEIGAGQGLHAIQYCQKNPGRTLIAAERTSTRFAQLNRRHHAHPELKNLFPVHADALSLVTHWIHDQSLERVFLLYPNPYPKLKQANLRWHNMPFMKTLLAKMKDGAQLTLATNIETYMSEAKEQFTTLWGLKLIDHRRLHAGHTPRTHFEKKYLERGEPCWNLLFQKY